MEEHEPPLSEPEVRRMRVDVAAGIAAGVASG